MLPPPPPPPPPQVAKRGGAAPMEATRIRQRNVVPVPVRWFMLVPFAVGRVGEKDILEGALFRLEAPGDSDLAVHSSGPLIFGRSLIGTGR